MEKSEKIIFTVEEKKTGVSRTTLRNIYNYYTIKEAVKGTKFEKAIDESSEWMLKRFTKIADLEPQEIINFFEKYKKFFMNNRIDRSKDEQITLIVAEFLNKENRIEMIIRRQIKALKANLELIKNSWGEAEINKELREAFKQI